MKPPSLMRRLAIYKIRTDGCGKLVKHMDGTTESRIIPQERDFAILRGLYESRTMTVGHAATVYFESNIETAKKRMQKLRGAGLIRDRARHAHEPTALLLTKKGFHLLKSHGRLEGYPVLSDAQFDIRSHVSALTLRHELQVVGVKAALLAVLSTHTNVRVITCTTWPLLSQFQTHQPAASGYGGTSVIVKPDGYLCLHEKDAVGIAEHHCFIEVDRGTESQRVLAERAASYRAHYRSGGFAESRGGSREGFENYPFRVLVIFPTAERRNSAAERLLLVDPPIKTMVWLTTMPEMLRDPLGPIWIRPVDYDKAITDCGFEIVRHHRLGRYRRQTERDAVVAGEVRKQKLLNSDAENSTCFG